MRPERRLSLRSLASKCSSTAVAVSSASSDPSAGPAAGARPWRCGSWRPAPARAGLPRQPGGCAPAQAQRHATQRRASRHRRLRQSLHRHGGWNAPTAGSRPAPFARPTGGWGGRCATAARPAGLRAWRPRHAGGCASVRPVQGLALGRGAGGGGFHAGGQGATIQRLRVLPVPERCVKTPLIEAESAGIARAKASICNDEQRCLKACKAGIGQKTFSPPLRPRPGSSAPWRARQVVAHRAVRYAQAPGDFCMGGSSSCASKTPAAPWWARRAAGRLPPAGPAGLGPGPRGGLVPRQGNQVFQVGLLQSAPPEQVRHQPTRHRCQKSPAARDRSVGDNSERITRTRCRAPGPPRPRGCPVACAAGFAARGGGLGKALARQRTGQGADGRNQLEGCECKWECLSIMPKLHPSRSRAHAWLR